MPSNYSRVKCALLEALARSEEDRPAYLLELAREDRELSREVCSLLEQKTSEVVLFERGWDPARVFASDHPRTIRLEPYTVLEELGRGGSGVVYLALDPTLDRKVALKVLPVHVTARGALLERFQHEARTLASLAHPNIGTIYALHADHDPPFLAMEYVDGGTLADRLAHGGLSEQESVTIGHQVALALEAAHGKGVVHRDLKPANVMLTRDSQVKVVDFGLALAMERDGEQVAAAEGTPGYMSPEQADVSRIDARADIWSFGCLLFECLTGAPAFGSGSALERLERSRAGDVDWTALPDTAPPRLRDVLRGCLRPDPEERARSIGGVREELEEAVLRHRLRDAGSHGPAGSIDGAHNLPPVVDRFFGRERELEELAVLIDESRMVTLTGAGGSGKTRLALEMGRRSAGRYRDGVWFVDLAKCGGRVDLAEDVVRALPIEPAAVDDPADALTSFLRERHLLLILDNCEQVRETTSELVHRILETAPFVNVLVTSRESLDVAAEVRKVVDPLKLESETSKRAGAPSTSEAVQLFIDRARRADRDFDPSPRDLAAADRICRRVEGIPLAIELAAGRVRALSVPEIADHLDHRFSLLGVSRDVSRSQPGRSSRHRSLFASLDWTYQLLSEDQKRVFRRLAVFPGGWTLAAAETVCADPALPAWEVLPAFVQLAEKSLVRRDASASAGGRSRYRMFEIVREFAMDRLREAFEEERAIAGHTEFFVEFAREAKKRIHTEEQTDWVSRLDADLPNLRQCLDASLRDRRDVAAGMQLAAALGDYWQIRGHYREAAAYYELALSSSQSHDDPRLRTLLLVWAGNVALARGRFTESRAYLEESVAISERESFERSLGSAVNSLGVVAWKQGDVAGARACYERAAAIWKRIGEDRLVGVTLNNLGVLDMETGDYAGARAHYRESLAVQERLGNRHAEGVLHGNIGLAAMQQGRYDDAETAFDVSLRIRREVGDQSGIAHALNGLGSVHERRGDADAAIPRFEESLAIYEDIGDLGAAIVPLLNLGFVAVHRGETNTAATSFRRALALAEEGGDTANVSRARAGLGMVAMAAGDLDATARLLREALVALEGVEDRWGIALVLDHAVTFLEASRRPCLAAQLLGFLDVAREELSAPRTAFQQEEYERVLRRLGVVLSAEELAAERDVGRSLGWFEATRLFVSMEPDT